MTSAAISKSVHKPQEKKPPMLPKRPEAASPEIPVKGHGTLLVDEDQPEELYSAVLCCTFQNETK